MTSKKYLYWITFVAINGGFLFGLNIAGISGANAMIKSEFGLTDSALGTVAALLTIGALVGALFSGRFADLYGRKKVMVASAVLYTLSALVCAFTTNIFFLDAGRVLSGIAVGITSVIAPMYISEISPAKSRGTMVSLNQFAITIGILLAYVFDYFLIGLGNDSWRYMLGIPAVFGLIFLILLFMSFPESPRWLLAKGKKDNALLVLLKVGGETSVKEDLPAIEFSLNQEKDKERVSLTELFKGKTGRVVLIATVLAAAQQITGVNAVLIYAPDIFQAAGSMKEGAMFQSVILGLINFLMTIVALWLIDSQGRKTLLLWGAAGMAVSLGYLTYEFSKPSQNAFSVLIALLTYVSFFAASLAPVMWVVISEIYPSRIRGVAMSFSTAICWLCCFLTIQFAPVIRAELGTTWMFAVFTGFCVLTFLFVIKWIPETKGKSLEQIESEFISSGV
ncbi:sugar porter (SP) family MFS transporter [Arcticibacter tournemirensis]|uniref:Sugar porter family MFS transporter n=1 Tax=Arcticibacter tournemirensis TaxID=699437 RepID=A0A5M9H921_9SPHI|nr:sugar porter family MFS transporter [Arcticibacter tournemirensis]KAA8483150.1 sugar porter family MFS transporter [Arcticibacter tournemirensis]TQM51933.1 sugar porter (SP) family MFS transporter [Arcticibacter tournemirensis]